MAVIAQLLYVAAQTGIGSFFINYTVEVKELQLNEMQGGLLLGIGGMGVRYWTFLRKIYHAKNQAGDLVRYICSDEHPC